MLDGKEIMYWHWYGNAVMVKPSCLVDKPTCSTIEPRCFDEQTTILWGWNMVETPCFWWFRLLCRWFKSDMFTLNHGFIATIHYMLFGSIPTDFFSIWPICSGVLTFQPTDEPDPPTSIITSRKLQWPEHFSESTAQEVVLDHIGTLHNYI